MPVSSHSLNGLTGQVRLFPALPAAWWSLLCSHHSGTRWHGAVRKWWFWALNRFCRRWRPCRSTSMTLSFAACLLSMQRRYQVQRSVNPRQIAEKDWTVWLCAPRLSLSVLSLYAQGECSLMR